MTNYDPKSAQAEVFIHHEEILASLAWAEENKDNRALVEELLLRARDCKGLSHREAALLLAVDEPDLIERMLALAKEIKEELYGKRVVLFAPLYLSNYCVNGCTYCPYHAKNKQIRRKKLTQEEIRRETLSGNCEAAVLLDDGSRVRAAAALLVLHRGRWVMSTLEIG